MNDVSDVNGGGALSSGSIWARVARSGDPGGGAAESPQHPPPGVAVRADLPAAIRVLWVVVALGVPLGLLWALLAPPQVVAVVAGAGAEQVRMVPLDGQNEQRFAAMGTFLLFGLATGILVGAALWLLLRQRRGPVVLLAGIVGSMAATLLAAQIGVSFAEWRYPLDPAVPGAIVVRPPVLESLWVVIAPPFAVAMTYAIGVAWNGREDMGRVD